MCLYPLLNPVWYTFSWNNYCLEYRFIYYPKFILLHIFKLTLHVQLAPSTEKQNVKCSEMWVVISIKRLKKKKISCLRREAICYINH